MKKGLILGIAVMLSAPGFAQWEIDRKMTDYATFDDYGSKNNAWTIAVQDTFVHITWEHRSGFPGRLYHVRSTDCGETFGAHQQVIAEDCHCASICLWDSYVHIVWEDERGGNFKIYYVRSSDYGVTWDVVDHCITADLNYSGYPCICCSDNFVHIVWCDNRNGNDEIYYERSSNYGASWDISDHRFTSDGSYSRYPSIRCSDSVVHVAWYDGRDGNAEIYYKRSINAGASWSGDTRLTTNTASSAYPSLCCSDSVVNVVWHDNRDGNYEIYQNRSIDRGATWDIDNFRLTNDDSLSQSPSICCFGSYIHVIWKDERDGNTEIYYNHSNDRGATWNVDKGLTVHAVGVPDFASVACCACLVECPWDVHLAWTDTRDGNKEIYYKRHQCDPSGVENDRESELKSLRLRVFPNPFIGFAEVRRNVGAQGPATDGTGIMPLKIYDMSGRLVESTKSKVIGRNLAPGIYFVRAEGYTAEIVVKLR
jgi:hypothetical protein